MLNSDFFTPGRGLQLTLVLCVLLSGCASVSTPPRDVGNELDNSFLFQSESEQVTLSDVPSASYDDDPLFRLLLAEFAGQRGHLELAVEHYLEVAQATRNADLAERATRVAVFARDDAAALVAAKMWVALRPDDLDARQISAAMHIRAADPDAALADLEYILAADGGEVGSKLRMVANLLGREEDKATALAVMEKLLQRHRDNPDALIAYALLAIRADELDKARAAMEVLVSKTEINTNIAVAYLAVLQKQGMVGDAIAWLETALARTPDQFGLRLLYARLLAENNRFDEARTQFGLLAREQPDNTDVTFALGLLNLQANDVNAATENFKRLALVEERRDEAMFYLGQIAETKRQPEDALAYYRQIEAGGNYLAAQIRIALLLSTRDGPAVARAHLRAIEVQDASEKMQILRAEGEILAEHKQYDAAMQIYDLALAAGYDMEMLYTRAMLAERMGRLDILEADLRAILAREPDNAQALNALGYTLADRTDRLDEAHSLITRALAINPSDFYVLDSMGWVLYRLGRLQEAVSYLERARALKNDPEVAAHLGEVLWVMGEENRAREVWEAALELTPNDEKILKVIKRLAK